MECPKHLLSTIDLTKVLEFPIGTIYDDINETLITEYVDRLDIYFSQRGIEEVGSHTWRLPRELVRNAYTSGRGKQSIVTLGLFLSPESVVVGCNDGGDYFMDPQIKSLWETKTPIASRGMQYDQEGHFVSGYNNGNKMIYGMTDEIFIDTKTGTFFGMFNPRIYLLSGSELEDIFKKRSQKN